MNKLLTLAMPFLTLTFSAIVVISTSQLGCSTQPTTEQPPTMETAPVPQTPPVTAAPPPMAQPPAAPPVAVELPIPAPKCKSSATLTWDKSTDKNVMGYRISYGPQRYSYDYKVTVKNPNLTSYTVRNLEPGVHYFAVQAFNKDRMDSPSTEAVINLAKCKASKDSKDKSSKKKTL